MRRPACAPPPKICTSGSGSVTGSSPARYCHSGMSCASAAACATASDTATVALPPSVALFGVPSSSISFASMSAWSSASMPKIARAIGPRTLATACATSKPPWRVPPSRRSTASREPRDAPAGAMPRPTTPHARRTSASTVGRPRESQTRRACTRVMVVGVMATKHARVVPALAGGCARYARAKRRIASRSRRSVTYSTGDLPSTRASSSPGSSAAVRASSAGQGSHVDVRPVGARPARETSPRNSARHCGRHTPFSSRWLSTNARSNAGIAVPRAFGVEDHRAGRADQDVLRAEVAVHQHPPGARRRGDQRQQPRAEVRMRARGRHEIGVEPDRVEQRVGREARRDVRAGRPSPRGCGRATSPTCAGHRDRPRPSASSVFQTGYRSGGSHAIAKAPASRSSPRIAGTASGTMPRGHAHPFDFPAVALDRAPASPRRP